MGIKVVAININEKNSSGEFIVRAATEEELRDHKELCEIMY